MIQTQLLKADKPYQIISAAGMVGIQVATLIVTEEKSTADGGYLIDTHSHPVVNYGNKEGLEQDLKYFDGNPDEVYKYTKRMQPEGAVWNKVEVRDVKVLGLAGADNPWVDIETFFYLVPSLNPYNPLENLWDISTAHKMHNLFFSLERVGLKINKHLHNVCVDRDSNQIIKLELEEKDGQYQVLVIIRDEDYEGVPAEYPLYFRCRLENNPLSCISAIGHCMAVLYMHFDFNRNLKFVYNRKQTDQNNKWADHLKRVTMDINNNWKEYLTRNV